MTQSFKAKIYQLGINWCVDVPARITRQMTPERGYIRIKGLINEHPFTTTLVPVKEGPYRLFVNALMMKGANTAVGKVAQFEIEQNVEKKEVVEYPMHPLLLQHLRKYKLGDAFDALTPTRKRNVLKYLHQVKGAQTLQKNIDKVIAQLKNNERDVRIP